MHTTLTTHVRRGTPALVTAAVIGVLYFAGTPQATAQVRDHDPDAILPGPVPVIASTVPSNGDLNPYGVAFVGKQFPSGGPLNPGDVLVSNFNNAGSPPTGNLQGTGSTIVRITPTGTLTTFFQGKPAVDFGLTTALGLLNSGFVIVGNLPTVTGSCPFSGSGSLLILDRKANIVNTLSDSNLLDGPWDMTVNDEGSRAQLFVSNVLSGTVTRVNLQISPAGITVESLTRIGSGFMHRCDPAALVVGPTGLVYDPAKDLLYVASTEDNAVFEIRDAKRRWTDAGTGRIIYHDDVHLHGPLGMAMSPNGHLIVSNSDVINPDPKHPSELTEFTIEGRFVAQLSIDPNAGGSFGLAFAQPQGSFVRFAAVDDNVPNITIWNLRIP